MGRVSINFWADSAAPFWSQHANVSITEKSVVMSNKLLTLQEYVKCMERCREEENVDENHLNQFQQVKWNRFFQFSRIC